MVRFEDVIQLSKTLDEKYGDVDGWPKKQCKTYLTLREEKTKSIDMSDVEFMILEYIRKYNFDCVVLNFLRFLKDLIYFKKIDYDKNKSYLKFDLNKFEFIEKDNLKLLQKEKNIERENKSKTN